ncbi:hypothetical protein V6N11_084190 [Hibiscus sabdariffa]|uniref:Uncharacterized protein n=1 Tax=Hibiscus sabdariffa TaxID=183260 RepID=A0ABR2QSE2_9ROSI
MGSVEETIHVRDCLHGKWIYRSLIRVTLPQRETRNQLWRRKKGDSNPGGGVLKVNVREMSMAELHDVHHMEGMGVEDHLNILQRFSIGWCRTLISNSSLAEEIRLEKDQQAYECREVGEKLPMEVSEVVGNGDMYDAEMDRVYGGGTSGVSWRGNILWEGQLHAPDVVTLVVQVDEQDANGVG